jgi:NAD(P)-dependent dehydrogenase (short-subunit alcohol dehydrogenase family)
MHADELRVAVVTGANRGIGRAVCRQLAEREMTVVLTSRDRHRGEAAADLERIGRAWQTNTLGAWRVTLALLPLLRAATPARIVNAVRPGWTATDMGGGGRPVDAGAASVVWAALLDDDDPTGGVLRDGQALPW